MMNPRGSRYYTVTRHLFFQGHVGHVVHGRFLREDVAPDQDVDKVESGHDDARHDARDEELPHVYVGEAREDHGERVRRDEGINGPHTHERTEAHALAVASLQHLGKRIVPRSAHVAMVEPESAPMMTPMMMARTESLPLEFAEPFVEHIHRVEAEARMEYESLP